MYLLSPCLGEWRTKPCLHRSSTLSLRREKTIASFRGGNPRRRAASPCRQQHLFVTPTLSSSRPGRQTTGSSGHPTAQGPGPMRPPHHTWGTRRSSCDQSNRKRMVRAEAPASQVHVTLVLIYSEPVCFLPNEPKLHTHLKGVRSSHFQPNLV